jgi:hypothetical protein
MPAARVYQVARLSVGSGRYSSILRNNEQKSIACKFSVSVTAEYPTCNMEQRKVNS